MNIIVCYDGSSSAETVLAVAIKIGKALGAGIHLMTSILIKEEAPDKFEFIKDERTEKSELVKIAQDRAQKLVEKEGLDCETHISDRGLEPGEDIVGYAKEINAGFIVVGIRHRSKVGKLLFGSTAQYVVLNAPCPVVTVKKQEN